MTRKDYELIARDVARVTAMEAPYSYGGTIVARNLASSLSSTNPRFDRDRFLRACGVEG